MPELTDVEFQFYKPDGTPLADTVFSITLKRSGFITEAVGVVVPDVITATTDAEGKVVIKLHPSSTPYFLQLPADAVVDEDCCSNALARYKFYVPEVAPGVIVRAQDLFIAVAPSNVPYDEEAILIITEAKLTSVNAAREALASAVRAETAAVSIEGDADRAEAARDAAEASKNAAAGSAQASANSAAASSQSAADALASKNAAANSANAANNSAVSASNDAGRAAASEAAALASKNAAAGSATAASGSATTATNAANSATASKDAAAASATTASTKAGEASTSAGNALTQANRAKTEADRAVAATDGKQDKNGNLTALSALSGAADRMFYFTSGSAMALAPLTTKARALMARADTSGMQSELGLIPVASPLDVGPGKLVTPGWMGLGVVAGNRLPDDNAQIAVPAGNYYVPATWAGSPFPGTDSRNQGYLTVEAWSSSAYMVQTWKPLQRGTAPMMHRYAYTGQWQPWQLICSGVTTQSDATMASKLEMRNVLGIGTPHTYCIDMDAVAAPSLILGYSYVTNSTLGSKPGGYVYGIVNTVVNAADHCHQEFVGLNAIPGVTQRAYRRSGYGTGWGPWRLIIDSGSAVDVNIASGGIMERTTVGDYVLSKYANGTMTITGYLGSIPAMAANEFKAYNATIPSGIATVFGMFVWVTVTPVTSFDTYGVVSCYPQAGNQITYVIRNGPNAQAFDVRVFAQGSWK